jgi:GNAT superfamily N-acetyltransferase
MTAAPTISIRPYAAADDGLPESILRALPDWFGIESALLMYAADARRYLTFIAEADGAPAGFITLHAHFPAAAEVHCIAVLQPFHRRGVGRALIDFAERHLRTRGVRFLQVKTQGESRPCENYARTLRFYLAMGFVRVEEFSTLWPGVPALMLIKAL